MSTAFIPNATVTVLDTAVVSDERGDPAPDDVVTATGLPAVWVPRNQRTWLPAEQRATITRGFEVRLRPGTVVTEAQRLRNEITGELGYVDAVDVQRVIGIAGDVIVRLVAVQDRPVV